MIKYRIIYRPPHLDPDVRGVLPGDVVTVETERGLVMQIDAETQQSTSVPQQFLILADGGLERVQRSRTVAIDSIRLKAAWARLRDKRVAK
jgi:hypothetical protein